MDLSVHIILSEDASSLLQATYPSSHLNCSALGPIFERFFYFRRAQRDSTEAHDAKNNMRSHKVGI